MPGKSIPGEQPYLMNVFRIIRLAGMLVMVLAVSALAPTARADEKGDPSSRLLRDASLMILKEGNARYVSGKSQHPHLDAERRRSTAAQGQEPFATILACSDSRDPVELVFDRGVGDLFVVRVAGNVAGISELASVEYGVGHLNTPLLIVMGHTRCGTVTAVVKGAELHGHLHALAEKIKPVATKAKSETTDLEDAVPRAIQANVWQTVEGILKHSRTVREKVADGSAHLMGALYDLETGKVSWLGSHPAQDSLIVLAEQAETDATLAIKQAGASPSLPKSPMAKEPLATAPVALGETAPVHHHDSNPVKAASQPKSH
jgi:carbonic anhydrase